MLKFFLFFSFIFTLTLADSTAQQTVTIYIVSINDVDISGADPTFTLRPNLGPQNFTQTSEAYTISIYTNDGATKKITAQLDNNMPDLCVLSVNMSQAYGALSKGYVALSTNESDLLTNIAPNSIIPNLQFTYLLQIGAKCRAQTFSRQVLFTLTDN